MAGLENTFDKVLVVVVVVGWLFFLSNHILEVFFSIQIFSGPILQSILIH